ncbi:hypothetical protein [Streptomyces oceani]|uniref:hypothetical protein n=1 Tax=Streptomyces oceani TaxID=1075402 RepID=UPI00087240E9|nr:hypothetical protein [Streptomyces oceani]
MVLIGAAALAVVGVLIGAFVGFGGESESNGGGKEQGAAPASPEPDKTEAPDPAEAQAKELDKLLERSNNSRASVIKAVQNIKSCKALAAAGTDLRAAAKQRNGLVTSLGELDTGALPNSAQLNSALVEAWKASAKADSAYAAWAKQVSGKKGCPKGEARSTKQQALGNRASGEATAAKKKAASLWNPTAKKYGLAERQITQL